MDEAPKSLWQMILTFMGVFIFISLLTFSINSSKAREVLYSTIENIEIYGYNEEDISQHALKTGTTINVTPIEVSEGYRYNVSVSFKHFFAILSFDRTITYEATTRVVEY